MTTSRFYVHDIKVLEVANADRWVLDTVQKITRTYGHGAIKTLSKELSSIPETHPRFDAIQKANDLVFRILLAMESYGYMNIWN